MSLARKLTTNVTTVVTWRFVNPPTFFGRYIKGIDRSGVSNITHRGDHHEGQREPNRLERSKPKGNQTTVVALRNDSCGACNIIPPFLIMRRISERSCSDDARRISDELDNINFTQAGG
jgi:hypothetical protein